ncbi:MAG TPA: histidine kinase, partial [Longimicrobium sp.]|nr:histidine kinase [Longimicrobium sp.]
GDWAALAVFGAVLSAVLFGARAWGLAAEGAFSPGRLALRSAVDTVQWGVLAAAALGVSRLTTRRATAELRFPTGAVLLAPAVLLAFAALRHGTNVLLTLRPDERPAPLLYYLGSSWATLFLLYTNLATAAHGVVYLWDSRARRVSEQETEARLARARLHALQAQLHPHFLFNALNSVSALLRRDPAAADRMLARVGELLRRALAHPEAQVVALEEEVELVRLYLEIERVRFGARLRTEVEVDDDARAVPVPALVLQPLVENAVRHGIAPLARGGRVRVSARLREGAWLHLAVEDDGAGLHAGRGTAGTGVGLANTRARLASLYGPDHRFEVGPAPGGGTRVEVVLPVRNGSA